MARKVIRSLGRRGFNAIRVYDAGLSSQADVAIFAYARAHHMTIITFDTDYLNQTAFPPPHAGILVLRSFPRDISVTEIAYAVLNEEALLDSLDISNRDYLLGLH